MNSGDSRRIEAPPFSDRRIVREAEELIRKYVRATAPPLAILTINFDHIYDYYIYPTYGIALQEDCDLGYDAIGKKVLGRFDIETNTAYIDASLGPRSRDPRRVFTCWHEIGGHGILQGDWIRRESARFQRLRHVVTTEESIDERTENTLERQANLFASHAAAPTWFLERVIQETYEPTRPLRYVGPGPYCLSVNRSTQYFEVEDFNHLCRVVARHISCRFGGLSNEALGYRVAQVGWFITDATRPRLGLNRIASTPGRSPIPSAVVTVGGWQSQHQGSELTG